MSSRRVWLAALATLAAGGVVFFVVNVLSAGEGGTGLPNGSALSATAHIDQTTPLFGDEITAEIDIAVDRGRADPAKVHVRTPFSPLEPVRRQTRRWNVGRIAYIRKTWTLRCLSRRCAEAQPTFAAALGGAKGSGRRATPLPAAQVVYAGRGVPSLTLAWPTVEWLSRINQTEESSGSFFYHVDLRPPPISYATSPGHLLIWLTLTLFVLLAIPSLIVRRRLVERRRARRPLRDPDIPPLECALRLLEHAARETNGDVSARRRALELVAVELQRSGRGELSGEPRALAWQSAGPPADEAEALGARIRASVGSNGAAPA